MRVTALGLALVCLAGACDGGNPYTYSGIQMPGFFPFDGSRTWTYTNEDFEIHYKLEATLQPDFELYTDGFAKIWTVTYETRCTGAADCTPDMEGWLRDVRMSSDASWGTLIHGWDSPATGPVLFDPPIKLTDSAMKLNDTVTTSNHAGTFTSRFAEMVGGDDCPQDWVPGDWNECLHMELCNGTFQANANNVVECVSEGDPLPLAGDYYAVGSYNIIALDLVADPGMWRLASATWAPDN